MSIYTTPVLNINLKKLIDNYKQLMTMSTPAIPAAVVKDDAYGIGAKIVTQTLYNRTHCRHFFVAHAKEGADIRPYAPDATIYVLQGIGADTLSLFDRHNLVPVISSPEMLKFWQQYKLPNNNVFCYKCDKLAIYSIFRNGASNKYGFNVSKRRYYTDHFNYSCFLRNRSAISENLC